MVRRLPPLCCLDPFQSQETPYASLYWWTSVSGAYGHIKGLKTITHFQINWRTVLGTRTQVLLLRVFSPKSTVENERCFSRQQPILLRTVPPSVSVALRTTCCSRRDNLPSSWSLAGTGLPGKEDVHQHPLLRPKPSLSYGFLSAGDLAA